jgi:hypothetical protein
VTGPLNLNIGRLVALLCATLLVAIVTVGAADAYTPPGFGIARYSVAATEESGSADTQAGSHPYELTLEAGLDPSAHDADTEEEARNLDFELPAGLTVDPAAVSQDGVVGSMQMEIEGKPVSATVYNLQPAPGELGRLGFTIKSVQLSVSVAIRADGNHVPGTGGYGITLSMENIPHFGVESVKLTLGESSSGLLTLPTACAEQPQTTVRDESWGGETALLSASLPRMTGCNLLAFAPSLDVTPSVSLAGEPSGYALQLRVPQDETLGEPVGSQLQSASVTLPAETSLSAANGLAGCTEAQFTSSPDEGEMCPDDSQVGTIEIATPLLSRPLKGSVFLATHEANPPGAAMTLYVAAEETYGGVAIRLVGQITMDPSTGQSTLTFDELPQLPIGEVELKLFGGEQALLVNPPTCGPATSTASLMPWSGGGEARASSSFAIEGCRPSAALPAGSGSPGSGLTGAVGGSQTVSSAVHRNMISKAHGQIVGNHVLLTFTASTAGTVAITGRSVQRYVKKLHPGTHRIRLALSKRGLFDIRHHRRVEFELTLRTARDSISTQVAVG